MFVALRGVATFRGVDVVVVQEDRTFTEVVFGGGYVVGASRRDGAAVVAVVGLGSVVGIRSGVPGDAGTL